MSTTNETHPLIPARLILASASPYKIGLLTRMGLRFTAQDAAIDETRRPDEAPEALARRLAREKAQAVAAGHPDAFVIGADQVIALEDRIFSKPGTFEVATEHLQALQGRTHLLMNAVALATPDGLHEALVTYEMTMRPLTEREIGAYLLIDEPFDCAGAYRFESSGILLFQDASGPDPTAIEGLPLTRVYALLREGGYFRG